MAFNDYGRETFAPRVESIEWLSGTVKQRIVSSVDQTWQMAGFALMCVLLPIMVWRRKRGAPTDWISVTAAATVALVSGMIGAHMVIAAEPTDAVSSSRNFFGILRVSESAAEDPHTRTLTNGHITHGVQRLDDAGRRRPTTYYSEESGVGVAINTLRRLKGDGKAGMRIGVVGLGAGTLAAYGIDGDVIRFYEINADVLRLNRQHFTFLKDTPARVDVSLGDARIIMERERTGQHPQQFDVIAVDAFSGDAVPLHLLTREAFATYFYHLAPDGVLAMHVSNRYLNLASLVHDLAEDSGRPAIRIQNVQDLEQTIYASTWVLVTSNKAFLDRPARAGSHDLVGREPRPAEAGLYRRLREHLSDPAPSGKPGRRIGLAADIHMTAQIARTRRSFVLEEAVAILARTPATLDALLRGLPEGWIAANEGSDTWSPFDVIGHLIHGERTDWVPRARIIREDGETRAFEKFDRFAQFAVSQGRTLAELLDEFAALRRKNLRALEALRLTDADLDRRGRHPELGLVTMRQLLAAWMAHDLDHVVQISRVLARQYSDEVGPWRAYLRIISGTQG